MFKIGYGPYKSNSKTIKILKQCHVKFVYFKIVVHIFNISVIKNVIFCPTFCMRPQGFSLTVYHFTYCDYLTFVTLDSALLNLHQITRKPAAFSSFNLNGCILNCSVFFLCNNTPA